MSEKVLVVDDEATIVKLVTEFLAGRGYEAYGSCDPRESLFLFNSISPGVCILDLRMPFITGSDLMDRIKEIDSTVELIFLTAQDETILAVDLMKKGAIDYLLKPVDLNQLDFSVSRAFQHRHLLQENATYKLHLARLVAEKTEALHGALRSLTQVHGATLDALAMALDYRDQSTSGHSRRVADLTAGIARQMGIAGSALVQIEHGALLHDIGKLKIPDGILWKPGKLTDLEWQTMRRHAEYGFDFLCRVEFLKDAAEIVFSHHEKFDGSGYPRGLKGDTIPFGARLFAIVDAVDAMIYERPYRRPISFQEAAAEIRSCAGSHFAAALVEPALEYLTRALPKDLVKFSS